MTKNVYVLPGTRALSTEPNQALVDMLADLLDDAKSGRLQSFVGTGFMADGARVGAWGDTHPNVYEMLGAISWLEHEYVHRRTTED